jgi:ribosomal protein S18 acetylase RimI-like enzyme
MASKRLIIRKAIKENLNDILSIIKEHQTYDVKFARRYYENFFSDKLDKKDEVYVAFRDEELVGVIGYFRDYFSTDYSYSLGWFGVKREFRRSGIGTKLLRRVQNDLKAMRNINRKLFVSTEDDNEGARSFYIQNGFRTEGVIRDYYGDGEDQLVMSKTLF